MHGSDVSDVDDT
jgi:hypothetical protein